MHFFTAYQTGKKRWFAVPWCKFCFISCKQPTTPIYSYRPFHRNTFNYLVTIVIIYLSQSFKSCFNRDQQKAAVIYFVLVFVTIYQNCNLYTHVQASTENLMYRKISISYIDVHRKLYLFCKLYLLQIKQYKLLFNYYGHQSKIDTYREILRKSGPCIIIYHV